jgi:hypothetical protein
MRSRPRHIAAQFLAESTTLGTLGGLIGTCIGVAIVVIFAAAKNWTAVLNPAYTLPAPLMGAAGGGVEQAERWAGAVRGRRKTRSASSRRRTARRMASRPTWCSSRSPKTTRRSQEPVDCAKPGLAEWCAETPGRRVKERSSTD